MKRAIVALALVVGVVVAAIILVELADRPPPEPVPPPVPTEIAKSPPENSPPAAAPGEPPAEWERAYRLALEEPAILELMGNSAAEFVHAFSAATGISVVLAPDYAERDLAVVLVAGGASAREQLESFVKALGAEWGLMDRALYICPPGGLAKAEAYDIALRLRERVEPEFVADLPPAIDVVVTEAQIEPVLRHLSELTGMSFILDPMATRGKLFVTTLAAVEMPLTDLMLWLGRVWNLDVVPKYDAFWITSRSRIWTIRRVPVVGVPFLPEQPVPNKDNPVTITFNNNDLPGVLAQLSKKASVDIVLSDDIRPGARLTLKMTETSFGSVIAYVTEFLGVDYDVQDGKVVVRSIGKRLTVFDLVRRDGVEESVYDVSRLTARGFDRIDLLVQKLIFPGTWGAAHGTSTWIDEDGILVVVHAALVHEHVRNFLDSIQPWEQPPDLDEL